MVKYCKEPFNSLVIGIDKKGETTFSPCCYNHSKHAWFREKSVANAFASKEMDLFRENAIGNRLGLCHESCHLWQEVEQSPESQTRLKWLQINVSLQCNARCSFCYQTNYKTDVDPAILDEVKHKVLPSLDFLYVGGGEPLLVGRELVELAVQNHPKVRLGMVTNGTFLSRYVDFAQNFAEINVSMNAGSRDVYKRVFGIDMFDRVVNGLKKFRDRGYSGVISLTFIYSRENRSDVENFLTLCSDLKIVNCAVILDQTDITLRVQRGEAERYQALAKALGLNCRVALEPVTATPAKTLKRAILSFVFYWPRRLVYAWQRQRKFGSLKAKS